MREKGEDRRVQARLDRQLPGLAWLMGPALGSLVSRHRLDFRHSHGGTGVGSAHNPNLGLSCLQLQPFKHCVIWRILSIPPAPAVFDKLLIQVRAI